MFKEIEFKSVGELVDFVLDGNNVDHSDLTRDRYLMNHVGGIKWSDNGAHFVPNSLTILKWRVKVDWKESLNEKPQWCWCWNDGGFNRTLALVNRYNENDRYYQFKSHSYNGGKTLVFKHAKLATKEDLQNIINTIDE